MRPGARNTSWTQLIASLDARLTSHFDKPAKPSPDFDRKLFERIRELEQAAASPINGQTIRALQ